MYNCICILTMFLIIITQFIIIMKLYPPPLPPPPPPPPSVSALHLSIYSVWEQLIKHKLL